MRFWRWLRRDRDDSDAQAAAEQQEKLAQARTETAWLTRVAATELAKLPPEQLVARFRLAMTLRPDQEKR